MHKTQYLQKIHPGFLAIQAYVPAVLFQLLDHFEHLARLPSYRDTFFTRMLYHAVCPVNCQLQLYLLDHLKQNSFNHGIFSFSLSLHTLN